MRCLEHRALVHTAIRLCPSDLALRGQAMLHQRYAHHMQEGVLGGPMMLDIPDLVIGLSKDGNA
jgi:hypothetical protein